MDPRPVKDDLHLLSAAQAGSIAAVDLIVNQFSPLINSLAFRFGIGTDHVRDLAQSGTVGLLDAVRRFDPTRQNRFSTYAYPHIQGAMLNYMRTERRHGGVLSLEEPQPGSEVMTLQELVGDGYSETDAIERIDCKRRIRRLRPALDCLTAREQTVVRLVYFEQNSKTQAAFALQVSKPRVSALLKSSLKKLKTNVA
jgi:RNA polymerase sigma factor (sigma-70 family)